MEFRNQPVTDILLALAEVSGHSIVPDETVSGNASFFFADSTFDDVLSSFLVTNRLYCRLDGNTYHVSRIFSSFDKATGLVTMKADEVDVLYLVRALSSAIGKTIIYDPLPKVPLTVNMEGLPPSKALEILVKRFPDYAVAEDASYFYVRKAVFDARTDPSAARRAVVVRKGDLFSLAVDKALFSDVIKELFARAGREYSLLTQTDVALSNLNFSDRPFEELLRLVLEQGNADYTAANGVCYIYEIQRKDVVKKLKTTMTVALKYLAAQDVSSLLPGDMSSSGSIRVDKAANALILTGSLEEISPIVDYLAALDRPLEGRSYRRYDVKYLKVKDLIALLPPRLLPIAPQVLPEGNSFVALLAPENVAPLDDFLAMVDRKIEGFPVQLRYIKSDELMKNLPPSVSKEDVMESGVSSIVFFMGSEEKRRIFLRELAVLDRPKPQIRYELLVVQYLTSSGFTWSKSVDMDQAKSTDATAVVAALSSLLSLNFDVVSQFGLLFSVKLSLELKDNDARIFADTTLNAIAGQDVKFQNTHTYRYARDVYDPDTKTYSVSTSQVTSGLIVTLNGWVSGDGMITMTVSTNMSNEESTGSGKDSVLPSTSERIVSTTVRSQSGKPVVIGGLLSREKSFTIQKVPVLGSIPLLGLLFQDREETFQDTEYVVYIVPYVTYGDGTPSAIADRKMEEYYRSFVADHVHE